MSRASAIAGLHAMQPTFAPLEICDAPRLERELETHLDTIVEQERAA